MPCRRCCGPWSRSWTSPVRSSSAPTTASRRCPRTPRLYLTPRHARPPRMPRPDLPVDELVDGLRAGGWSDLDNARTTVTMGPHRVELVGVDDPHIERDRYAAVSASRGHRRRADDGSGARALPARPRRHGGRRGRARPRRPHPRGPAGAARLRRPRRPTATSTGAGPRGCRAGGPERGAPSPAAPDDAAYLHVSAGLGTSPYAPVRFACRPEATLLTLVAR